MSVSDNNNTKRIIANTLWMIFDKVFMLLLNLLVTVKVANFFGAQGYGNYEYAVNLVAILEIFVTFVDGRVVKKRYNSVGSDTLVFSATMCRVYFSLISAVIGIVLILFLGRGREFNWVFIFLLINMVISNLRFGMVNRFEYNLKSKKTVIAADIAATVGSILQLFAISLECSIIVIAAIAAISSLINLILVIIQYRIEFHSFGIMKVDNAMVKSLVRESVPLAVAASCATIYTRCDSVMLGGMLTNVEVGLYAISIKIVSVAQIALGPIRESVYPKLINLYNIDKEEYGKLYVRLSSFLTLVCLVGILLSFLILPYCFKFLNEEYLTSLPVYKVLSVSVFFMYNAALRAGHYTLISRGDILMYSQIFSVFANILLNYFFIVAWGIYGAALATVCTQFLSLFVSNLFFGEDGKKVFLWQIMVLNPLYKKKKKK